MWKIGVVSILFVGSGWAQVTQRASVDSSGQQGNDDSSNFYFPVISSDGHFVAFTSLASDLVPGDTNGTSDIFVRDRQSGTTERVSVDSAGAQGLGESLSPSISFDGRYVAFYSAASNLVAGDTNGWNDVFVRDRQSGTTERVSVATGGTQGNGNSLYPCITADGRFVAFYSYATNLVPGDTNGFPDIFIRDRQAGTTERVSVSSGGAQGNGDSGADGLSISEYGRYVAFESSATNLVPGDSNGFEDVFVRDLQAGTTDRVSVDTAGLQGLGDSFYPSISADGRFVAFNSYAGNLVPGDTNSVGDTFVRDRQSSTTERVSVNSSGTQGNGDSGNPSISPDGRYVAFNSTAGNLAPGDTNGAYDGFVRDRQLGTTERVSISTSGAQGDGDSWFLSISADGRFIAFRSIATTLVPGDTNGFADVFVRDRNGTSFTSLCTPGGNLTPCPCSNPPSGTGRGCNNSAATGGAMLSASGIAYLSLDSLVFTTSGEKPTATSVLLQGTSLVGVGAVYGQGVRCVGGTLKRLFTKTASGGSITAPNFGAGDPTVSARSAARGNLISAGQSRWYLVFYRDPVVLGGCPASSTFNCTQTGMVTWSP